MVYTLNPFDIYILESSEYHNTMDIYIRHFLTCSTLIVTLHRVHTVWICIRISAEVLVHFYVEMSPSQSAKRRTPLCPKIFMRRSLVSRRIIYPSPGLTSHKSSYIETEFKPLDPSLQALHPFIPPCLSSTSPCVTEASSLKKIL